MYSCVSKCFSIFKNLPDFCAFYLPNITLASATKSELGQDNGRTVTFTCLVGAADGGGATDVTMIKYQTSTA